MNNKSRIPEDYKDSLKDVISNFDGIVDHEAANEIKDKELYGSHAGWNFHGRVWYQEDKWCCEVRCYGSWQGTFIADTLEEIMKDVSDEHGYE